MSTSLQPAQHALGALSANSILLLKALVCAKIGKGNTGLYADISAGLCVKPVKAGPRASRWPSHEIDAIVAARMAGASDDQVRALVTRLHELRQQQYADVLARVAA
jgi:prophage regulatory protein